MFNHLDFRNKISHLTLNHFNTLPKTGKPNTQEWTVLASIIKSDTKNMELVALGTGSKCIGATKMSKNGHILNDSHAEIICRRAFLRYLYSNIDLALKNDNNSIFRLNNDTNKFVLNDKLSFHFFTTHMPCGDAAIFPKQHSEDFGDILKFSNCTKLLEQHFEPAPKRAKVESDIFRTGAKCLDTDSKQDAKSSGVEYHTLGAIRIKPGRGDPTKSVSCSDKLAKWSFLGIQGALISLLVDQPIFLTSLTIIGGTPYSEESLLRALKTRFKFNSDSLKYETKFPIIGQSTLTFEFAKCDGKRPCPSSIIWCRTSSRPLEVSVDGNKQGVTKKNQSKRAGRLLICKKELFTTFIDIVTMNTKLNMKDISKLSYKETKNKAELYQQVWKFVKEDIFRIWTKKDEHLLDFCIEV